MGFLDQLGAQMAAARQANALTGAFDNTPDQGGLLAKLLGGLVGGNQTSAPGAPMQLSGAAPAPDALPRSQLLDTMQAGSPSLSSALPTTVTSSDMSQLKAAGAMPGAAAPQPPAQPPQPQPSAASTPSLGAQGLPMFAGAQGTPSSMSPNAQRALAFYQSKGLSPVASAALVGGFGVESSPGLSTTAANPGDGQDGSTSRGIAQWNGDRGRAFQQFAAANRLDPNNLDTQLAFSWAELNGPEQKTLSALQNAKDPIQATAAAIGYERPAGWTPENPAGAGTFGKRLNSTVAMLGGGAVPPLRGGSPYGTLDTGAFGPQPGAQMPSFAASGQGMQLSQATAIAAQQPRSADPHGLAYAPDAPTSRAPATSAIDNAAVPSADPLVPVPGYAGTWNKARIAAAPDGTDVPDDGELAKAQGGVAAVSPTAGPVTGTGLVPISANAPGTAAAASYGAPQMQAPNPQAAAVQPSPTSVATIRRLLSDPDTAQFGLELWKSMATRTPPAYQHIETSDGRVLVFNPSTGAMSAAPGVQGGPAPTDAIKNYQYAQSQGYSKSFTDYQSDQQKADKAQLIDVPLANGQMQKVWSTPGQDPTQGIPVGQPYTKRPDTAISIDNKGEGAEAQEAGKLAATRRGDMLAAADAAPDKIARLNLLGAVLDRTQTGPLAGAAGTVVNVANSLGISPDAISALGLNPNQAVDNQVAQKLANELVMGSIGAKNGGFPASNFSVAERQFIEKTFPNIAAQPGANAAVNDVLVAREQRNIQKGDAWSAYKQQQKAAGQPLSYEDFEGQWQQDHAGDNIFAPIQQKFVSGGYGPVGAPAPQPNAVNQPQAARQGGAPAAPPPVSGARQGRDGNFYVPDPNRPGKYLMVNP